MKNVKRQVSIAICLLMTSSIILTGCKKDAKTDTAVKETLAPYEISVLYPGGAVAKDNELVEKEINNYLKDKINATVKLKQIEWGSWSDKLNLMIASGEKYDIAFTAGWDKYDTNAAKGAFLDLDPLLEKNAKEMKAAMDPIWLTGARINGKLYAIPVEKEMGASNGLLLNKKLVDKYKFDLTTIKTIQDLEPMLKIIKEKESDVIPFAAGGINSPYSYKNGIFEHIGTGEIPGAIYRDKNDMKVVNEIQQPEVLTLLKLAEDWYKKGYINKNAGEKPDLGKIEKSGKFFAFNAPLKPGKDAEITNAIGVEVVQVPLTKVYSGTDDMKSAMMAISRTSENPDRAMMFLNLLHTDKKLVNLAVFGIEGKHYTKVSDNVIDYPSGVNGGNSGYAPGNAWMFGNQFNNYLFKNEDPQKWTKFKDFNKTAVVSPIMGFTFVSDTVVNEIGACMNVYKEFTDSLFCGVVDVDTYLAKYNEKLKAAGIDKIIAEKQKQLDEFMKTKK